MLLPVHIYTLTDPRTNQVRYVGLTRRPLFRLKQHLHSAAKGRSHRDNWIKGIWKAGLQPLFTTIAIVEESMADETERGAIRLYREAGCRLINKTDGGERGQSPSEETRRKLSAGRKGRKFGPMPEAQRKKISEANKGKKHGRPDQFRELNKARTGQPLSAQHRANIAKALEGKIPHHSDAAKEYIRQAAKARWARPEYREFMLVQARKGAAATHEIRKTKPDPRTGTTLPDEYKRKVSEGVRRSMTLEYRAKMSTLKKGKLMYAQTPESRANISKGVKAYFAANPTAKELLRRKAQEQFANLDAREQHKLRCQEAAALRKRTHCPAGHDLTETGYTRPSGNQECKPCRQTQFKKWRETHPRPSRAKVREVTQ